MKRENNKITHIMQQWLWFVIFTCIILVIVGIICAIILTKNPQSTDIANVPNDDNDQHDIFQAFDDLPDDLSYLRDYILKLPVSNSSFLIDEDAPSENKIGIGVGIGIQVISSGMNLPLWNCSKICDDVGVVDIYQVNHSHLLCLLTNHHLRYYDFDGHLIHTWILPDNAKELQESGGHIIVDEKCHTVYVQTMTHVYQYDLSNFDSPLLSTRDISWKKTYLLTVVEQIWWVLDTTKQQLILYHEEIPDDIIAIGDYFPTRVHYVADSNHIWVCTRQKGLRKWIKDEKWHESAHYDSKEENTYVSVTQKEDVLLTSSWKHTVRMQHAVNPLQIYKEISLPLLKTLYNQEELAYFGDAMLIHHVEDSKLLLSNPGTNQVFLYTIDIDNHQFTLDYIFTGTQNFGKTIMWGKDANSFYVLDNSNTLCHLQASQ